MKLSGITGSGSGKLGNAVFSTVRGETVVRQYQPQVANPSTDKQVEQRAKLKLMSQLAASLQPAIAIKRQGLSSGRNQFVSLNFDQTSFSVDSAQVVYENLQLTKSSIGLPAIQATRGAENISVNLAENAAGDIARVAYFQFVKNGDGKLTYINSVVAERGGDPKFTATLQAADGDVVVYGYGMRQTSEQATARYAQYNVQDGSDLATLYVRSLSSFNDIALTQTRAITLAAGSEQGGGAGSDANLFATINPRFGTMQIDNGEAAASVNAKVESGSALVMANINEDYILSGWENDGILSSQILNPYQCTFPENANLTYDLQAVVSLKTTDTSIRVAASLGANIVSAKVEKPNGDVVELTAEAQNILVDYGAFIRVFDVVAAEGHPSPTIRLTGIGSYYGLFEVRTQILSTQDFALTISAL